MKIIILFLLFAFINVSVDGQSKKRAKVKRKYRNVEQVNENLPDVYFSGEVHDARGTPLQGASVLILGLRNSVHTNEDGEFILKNLVTGKHRIEVSCIGYKTKTSDFYLQAGPNFHNIALDEEKFHVEPVIVNTQKRLQHIPDVSLSLSAVTFQKMEITQTKDIEELSDLVPGFRARDLGASFSGYTIRGITDKELYPGMLSRIGVLLNEVPTGQIHGSSFEPFDMEHVIVSRGPQNVLAGNYSVAGAVNFNTMKPSAKTEGYASAGIGEFNMKELKGALNYPVLKDKLYVRAAGIYYYKDGYIENTFGGTLNGRKSVGGRFSVKFLPAYNQRCDLVINYQSDRSPGTAFVNKIFANEEGNIGIFGNKASLNRGQDLGDGKELFDVIAKYRYYLNENSYFAYAGSFRRAGSESRWDGDGTAAQALDFADSGETKRIFQEIRFNFSRKSRLNGFIGVNYQSEYSDKTI